MISRGVHRGALALAIALCACAPKPSAEWHQEPGYRWRELRVAPGEAGFTQIDGQQSGIRFENVVSDSALVGNRVLGQGAGVALGDVDGDGLVDVFLARTEGCNALYRNRGAWRFQETTSSAGVGACDRHSSGAAFADVEGDGDLDLVLLTTTGGNAVYMNDGTGTFVELRGERGSGIDTIGRGATTLSMADVEGDGDLDLYIANYKAYHLDDSIPPQERALNRVVRQVAPERFEIVPEHRANYKLVMRPDMGGLRMTTRAEPDQFYVNDAGRFRQVPLTSGRFRNSRGDALSEEPESFTLSAKFTDLNGDGAPDLYVANDFEDIDELWLNDTKGNFRLADWKVLRQMSNSAMGIDIADVNGDGLPDIFEVDMLSNDSHRLKTQAPTHTALPKRPGEIETQLQQQRNALFINRGDATFAEVGYYAGVQASGWSWGTMFLDVDLDGWQDILVANGHLWDIMDADTHERLQRGMPEVPFQRLRWQFPRLPLKNVAFRNRGDLTFEDASERWKFGTEPDISHAMAAGDLDDDGDLDVVVNRLGAPALLLRNDATSPRVAVRLIGDAPNTFAVGAQLRLLDGAVPLQQREIAVGGLYLSHSDFQASFAMGNADSATLVIDWRSGRRSVIGNVKPNRVYEINAATASPLTRERAAPAKEPAPLFTDATSELGGHRHTETPFDDWNRQYLLPNLLSQFGPGVSWFDYDHDGDEDLIVGSGRGGRLGMFRNDRGRLVAQRAQGTAAAADFTTILGLSENGTQRLLAGVSAWEGQVVPAAVALTTGANGIDGSAYPLASSGQSATGPMALGDYDRDGDLDLFIGARVVTGQYPRNASSMMLRNDGGAFVVDSVQSKAFDRIGLVSGALFADIDGDGDADLLLAREWNSILLLLNQDGRLTAAADSWGLGKWPGRWNGVAAGDLDGDGRLDLVATSWGRNTITQADSTRPLVLLHGPFGPQREEEMLLARHDSRVKGLAPLNSYTRAREVIPGLSTRIRSFAAYADATVEQVLGPLAGRVERSTAVTLDNMVFFNRGNRFEAVPMPREAQFAPAFFAGVADFDGDGSEDVLLSQNFFPTAIGIPRYDGGRGLLLTGDGKGNLRPVPGQRSGILVYGDQRGAAYSDFDADGRLDLVISQNGAATRLFRNRGAKPGLRVRVEGPPSNPSGIGAQLRIAYSDHMGPVREIHAGSGYWSQNGAVQIFGTSAVPVAVWVRWPGGREDRVPVAHSAPEVVVRP